MRNVNTPPRRKSVINFFSTPPLRRSLFFRERKPSEDEPSESAFQSQVVGKAAPCSVSATDWDDDDDENTLTATGDISLSYPYYVPGVAGAFSPKPKSRNGTPTLRAQPQRPRPPVRRIVSVGTDTYKFRTLTLKGGPTPVTPSKEAFNNATKPSTQIVAETIRPPNVLNTPARHPGDESVSSISSFCGSIGSIQDEDPQLSTPQSRFEAFMKSRDLTCSPKKKESGSAVRKLDALAQAATSALGREVARPNTRPLRGNARLPARLPIPDWSAMDVDA
ncbi:hypothetical protein MVEN_02636800 [Mycena venus]|uniref:Uncharacterized protein n=1 Tax=Mycena venus TaxID=2733690 RepID=A0A8H6TYH1_9AGAR|nr:hypothetical protein MVEN_02636800 [Mycena venus]